MFEDREPAPDESPTWRRSCPYLFTAVLFALACGQAPLYYSNQNQYFLHGHAAAGMGTLEEDWLANTHDPTPLFSGWVYLVVRFLHPWVFHLCMALLQGIYAAALLGIFFALSRGTGKERWWPLFAFLLLLIHSAAVRWLSFRWLGLDYPWYLQAGVAGQYVLGGMFQPSVFGVLLVAAAALFAWDRPYLAALAVGLAGTFHATYLLSGALLILGFVVALGREGRWSTGAILGVFAFFLVLPKVAFVLLVFAPTDPQVQAEAHSILVNVRIPHHARVDLWLDEIAWVQIGWMALGVVLAWGTRLFPALLVAFLGATVLTAGQAGTGNDALALLFPWRLSAILVPLATALALTRLVQSLPGPGGVFIGRWVFLAGAALLTGVGLWIVFSRQAFHVPAEEEELYAFVRRSARPGDLYFLPVKVPALAEEVRGSRSSDFKPIPQRRTDTQVIPVNLQRFRLHAQAPIYVDFKSIPYQDVEVVEWRDRSMRAEKLGNDLARSPRPEVLDELRRLGVTHLVLPAKVTLGVPGTHLVHTDPYYKVHRLPKNTVRMAK